MNIMRLLFTKQLIMDLIGELLAKEVVKVVIKKQTLLCIKNMMALSS